tara:strand:+ start:1214 stop:2188 length:975 start_codon:yes stop_codon:yes gene_type:complete
MGKGKSALVAIAGGAILYGALSPKTQADEQKKEEEKQPDILPDAKFSVGNWVSIGPGLGEVLAVWVTADYSTYRYRIMLESGYAIEKLESELTLASAPSTTPDPAPWPEEGSNFFNVGDRVHSTLGPTLFLGKITFGRISSNVTVEGKEYSSMWVYDILLDVGGSITLGEIQIQLASEPQAPAPDPDPEPDPNPPTTPKFGIGDRVTTRVGKLGHILSKSWESSLNTWYYIITYDDGTSFNFPELEYSISYKPIPAPPEPEGITGPNGQEVISPTSPNMHWYWFTGTLIDGTRWSSGILIDTWQNAVYYLNSKGIIDLTLDEVD